MAELDTGGRVRTDPANAWPLCWMMFASTILCYVDRQSLALVRPSIQEEFGGLAASGEGFGWLMGAFGLSYALFQVPAGLLADAGNVRAIYGMAVGGLVAGGGGVGVLALAGVLDRRAG